MTALLAGLDDPHTRAAVTAERSLLAALEAGCRAPIGALADLVSDLDADGRPIEMISLRAVVGTLSGELIRASRTGTVTEPDTLGRDLAAELLELGGARLVAGAEHDREHGR